MRISDWSSDVCSSDLVDADRTRRRPLADDEVERAVFHRGIEDLLDNRIEAVNLVDEQHVMRLEICQQRGQIARLRSEGRRVGKEWGNTCRSWWSPYH